MKKLNKKEIKLTSGGRRKLECDCYPEADEDGVKVGPSFTVYTRRDCKSKCHDYAVKNNETIVEYCVTSKYSKREICKPL